MASQQINFPGVSESGGPPITGYTRRFDYGSDGLIYQAWAIPVDGVAPDDDDAVWAIQRTTYTASQVSSQEWADGDSLMNNVWTDRASLTYA